ncbi:CARMIL2 isoform 11 [Pan troglodytes]|uniref:Capping protein regulator and myosin 1 linker 2 n=2 Tax=Homininae TaxID=207598 RepID=R4GNC4_HUMAN|nr:capping protein regulator and myosin 1 linker 2 [Homo sapiens]KAI4055576.1 capping protein regulator and myosin 1 linker 2 [Homo sapiens]PNI91200.1 CARMIL2 isoform 11 [Pan troglodytes]
MAQTPDGISCELRGTATMESLPAAHHLPPAEGGLHVQLPGGPGHGAAGDTPSGHL